MSIGLNWLINGFGTSCIESLGFNTTVLAKSAILCINHKVNFICDLELDRD
jgi:hypothetical protein